VTDPIDIFQEYDWNYKQPFDVTDTYNYFMKNSQFESSKLISWSTVSNYFTTLNFDIKRVQYKFLYESTSNEGLIFEDINVNTYECE
jgi:hypothetical protein